MSNDNSKTKEMGPAVMNITFGEKELSVNSFAILPNGEIIRNPLVIGKPESHECVLDGEKAERIMPDGTKVKADSKKFKEIAEKRNKDKGLAR